MRTLDSSAPLPTTPKKIIVAYFSHSGNTRALARLIQEATGADVFEVVPVAAYPIDYDAVVEQAKQELNADFRPTLKSAGPDLKSYDVILVGSPNWWSTIAPPVMTFLEAHDVSGKIVVPFITHEGSRLGKSLQDVRRLSPGATVLPGQHFPSNDVKNAAGEVRKWLRELRLIK